MTSPRNGTAHVPAQDTAQDTAPCDDTIQGLDAANARIQEMQGRITHLMDLCDTRQHTIRKLHDIGRTLRTERDAYHSLIIDVIERRGPDGDG